MKNRANLCSFTEILLCKGYLTFCQQKTVLFTVILSTYKWLQMNSELYIPGFINVCLILAVINKIGAVNFSVKCDWGFFPASWFLLTICLSLKRHICNAWNWCVILGWYFYVNKLRGPCLKIVKIDMQVPSGSLYTKWSWVSYSVSGISSPAIQRDNARTLS